MAAMPLGERPELDELALEVAEARIAAKLFGVEQVVLVGRYRLLEEVGRGGMGVVWGAWDPELERKVAVKLVDPLRSAARDRIVDEARALAKLSHPNVVPIYDVGVLDDRVYLVMEWVAGENLRVHLHQPRRVREIVGLYVQAARGLAAVHAAGLVHRDFKPENAMLGRDGRVRVLDFGLARGDTTTGDVAGTPRYMAPEQRAGAAVTPAVDQYALCVALREALAARGDMPRWLAAIVTRGTADAPAERFAAMDDVIRALGRDPARVWGRRVLAGAAIAATAGAFAVGRAATADPCSATSADGEALAVPLRAAIAARLDALGAFAAGERSALLARLDDYRRGWGRAHHGACVAHDRGELTTALYERRLTCLARAEASLAATVEVLAQATRESYADARVAAGALVDPALCARVDQSLVPLPEPAAVPAVRAAEAQIERARTLATAARPDAVAAAAAARAAAEATGYAPVAARALLVEGRSQMLADDERAGATLERAMRGGFAAHDDATAVEAFARRAYVIAFSQGVTLDGTSVIEALAARLGTSTFPRLLLLNNLAAVRASTLDDSAGAQPLLEQALHDWRPGQSEDDYELVSIPQNLALAIAEPKRSLELIARARSELARLLGADHPRALEIDTFQVYFLALERARTVADSVCERLARLHPQLRDTRGTAELEAGWLADEAGDRAAAAAHFRAALLDPASDRVRAAVASTMAALDAGTAAPADLARAIEQLADAERRTARAPFARFVTADAYIAAARAWSEARDPVAAERCWRAARDLLVPIARPAVARRLARARTAFALAAGSSADAAAALGWYRAIGGYDSVVNQLAPIAEHH
jgi:protein kinase-like protein